MNPRQAHIVLANARSEIERVHTILEEYYDLHAVPSQIHFVIMLALDELITNIISYAYTDTRSHEIDVWLDSDEHRMTVTISDDGAPFNPLDSTEPDLTVPIEERPIGGLGIHLVRKLMDSVHYERRDGRNVLTFVKSFFTDSNSP